MRRRHVISSVFDNDLEEFLQSIDMLEPIKNREIRCHFCNKIIDFDNFRCVFPLNDEIKFCCDDMKCFEKVLEILKE